MIAGLHGHIDRNNAAEAAEAGATDMTIRALSRAANPAGPPAFGVTRKMQFAPRSIGIENTTLGFRPPENILLISGRHKSSNVRSYGGLNSALISRLGLAG